MTSENSTDAPGVGAELVRILLAVVVGLLSWFFWSTQDFTGFSILLRLYFAGASSMLLANLYWLLHPTLLRKQVWASTMGLFLFLNFYYNSLFRPTYMNIYTGLFLAIPTTLSLGYGAYVSRFAPPRPSRHQKILLLGTAWLCSLFLLRRASGPGWLQDQLIHWAPASALSCIALLTALLRFVWGESKWTELSATFTAKSLFLFASLSILYGFETLSPHNCVSPFSLINNWLLVLIPAGLAQFGGSDEGIVDSDAKGSQAPTETDLLEN